MFDVNQSEHTFTIDPYPDYAASPAVSVAWRRTSPPVENAKAGASSQGGLRFYLNAKRLFDIVFAVTLLAIALPFLILLSVALQIDSPGKLFFVQRRIGLGGKSFPCIKFRTMHQDADRMLEELLASDAAARREWAAEHKLRCDPRVSRFGRIVRKLSLDEFPQLLNILRGEMSVVGPRPIVSAEIERYGVHFRHYCAVRPGLTGLWQVSGRNDTSYHERVMLDVAYRAKASMTLDLQIVFRTIPAVLSTRGSY